MTRKLRKILFQNTSAASLRCERQSRSATIQSESTSCDNATSFNAALSSRAGKEGNKNQLEQRRSASSEALLLDPNPSKARISTRMHKKPDRLIETHNSKFIGHVQQRGPGRGIWSTKCILAWSRLWLLVFVNTVNCLKQQLCDCNQLKLIGVLDFNRYTQRKKLSLNQNPKSTDYRLYIMKKADASFPCSATTVDMSIAQSFEVHFTT